MSTRLREALVTGAVVAVGWLVLGMTMIPAEDRPRWFLVWIPLAVALSVMSHYLWHDKHARRREEMRSRPRYGEPTR
jgi:hypothetical protein